MIFIAFISTKDKIEFQDKIKGGVWIFPNNVDTDAISPGQYLDDLHATLAHTCETIDKEFPLKVKKGDIIIGGSNFGCGSSRETAPNILQLKGIKAIIAQSFARIFYRNCIAIGLPALELIDDMRDIEKGDEIEIFISKGEISLLRTKKIHKFNPLHELHLEILRYGGLEQKLLFELKNKD